MRIRFEPLLLALLLTSACTSGDGTRQPAAADATSAVPAAGGPPMTLTQTPRPAAPPDESERPRPAEIYRAPQAALRSPSAAASGVTTTDGDITLNFANADIREVVRVVLSDTLHLVYVIDPKVQGTITIETSRPIAREAALPTLEAALRADGAAMVEHGGVYTILPLDQAARAALEAGPQIGPLPQGLGYGLEIVPLKFVSAAEIEKIVEPFTPPGGTLRADPDHNMLIVSGTREELSGFVELVETLDIDRLAGMSFGLFPLQTASADEMVGDLEKTFGIGGTSNANPAPGSASGPSPGGGNAPEETEARSIGNLRFIPIQRLNAVLVVSNQASDIDRVRPWIQRLDRDDDEGVQRLHVYYVQNSRAVDLAAVLGGLFPSRGVTTTVMPQSPTAPGTTPTAIGSGQGAGGSLGGQSGQGSMFGQSNGQYPQQGGGVGQGSSGSSQSSSDFFGQGGARNAGQTPAVTMQGSGTGEGSSEGPAIQIVADEKNNALVIYATGRDYRMIRDALRRLDIVPLQVVIEATIAEVTLNNELQYGVQYYLQNGIVNFTLSAPAAATNTALPGVVSPGATSGGTTSTTTTGTSISPVSPIAPMLPGGAVSLGKTTPYLILSALSSVTDVNVISAPRIMVLDHQTAFLQVGDQVPIPTEQATSLATVNPVLVNTIDFRDTGVILQVTPHGNASGLVTLDIAQEVSAVTQTTSSTLNAPTFQQRRVRSTVAVQNGDTVALGGLISDSRTNTKNGLPILEDIPVLGSLFSTRNTTSVRTELLILLTPHVIGSSEEAHEVSEDLERRLRTIPPLLKKIQ